MKITAPTNMADVDPEGFLVALTRVLEQIAFAINGNLEPASNFKMELAEFVSNEAGEEVPIRHGLGRIPTGYIVVRRSTDMRVYDATTAFDSKAIYLKGSTTGTAKILIF